MGGEWEVQKPIESVYEIEIVTYRGTGVSNQKPIWERGIYPSAYGYFMEHNKIVVYNDKSLDSDILNFDLLSCLLLTC